jgi:hypothetical protein
MLLQGNFGPIFDNRRGRISQISTLISIGFDREGFHAGRVTDPLYFNSCRQRIFQFGVIAYLPSDWVPDGSIFNLRWPGA